MSARQMPQTPEAVLADVLHGLEVLGESTAAMVAGVNQQTENINRLALAIAERPTKRETVRWVTWLSSGALAVILVVLVAIWLSLSNGQRFIRQTVRAGEGNQCEAIRGIVNDARSYHGQPAAPPCPAPAP